MCNMHTIYYEEVRQMSKENQGLFNEANIADIIYARELASSSKIAIEKTSKGTKIALLAMGCFYVSSIMTTFAAAFNGGFIRNIFSTLAMLLGIGYLGLCIYAVISGGGFLKVLKTAGKVEVWAWYLIPIFPADLIIAAVACYLIVVGFIFIPVVYFLIMNKQAKKDLAKAEAFINAYEAEASRFNQV